MRTEARYHQPKRRGGGGKVHLHVLEAVELRSSDGRVAPLERAAGQALCGHHADVERMPRGGRPCGRCVELCARFELDWPGWGGWDAG